MTFKRGEKIKCVLRGLRGFSAARGDCANVWSSKTGMVSSFVQTYALWSMEAKFQDLKREL